MGESLGAALGPVLGSALEDTVSPMLEVSLYFTKLERTDGPFGS
jgi:hypothetical protein